MPTPPIVLTIAGSDSGGGAGIQADLKTFAAHGVFGTSVVTALTAQNTVGVKGVHAVPAGFVAAQLDAVLADLDVRAVKTGMLGDPAILAVVADYARAGRLPNLVVDPVVVATSGDLLYQGDPADYLRLLTPYATVLTPNIPEARVLGGRSTVFAARSPGSERDVSGDGPFRSSLAGGDPQALARAAGTTVVLKGGHAGGERSVDTVADAERVWELDAERVDTANTHGTGCTFSAAIAAGLARGETLESALRLAKSYITGALAAGASWRLGHGSGPVDHFWRH